MDQKPDHYSGQYGPVPSADSCGAGNNNHGQKGMRDRALILVPQQPEVKGYVIQVDGDGRNETGDIKPARHVNQARQDEQTQGPGGQMGDLIQ